MGMGGWHTRTPEKPVCGVILVNPTLYPQSFCSMESFYPVFRISHFPSREGVGTATRGLN